MPDQSSLILLCDTFRKYRVRADAIPAGDMENALFGAGYTLGFAPTASLPFPIRGTRYHYTCPSGLCYIYLLLPEESERNVLCIGPYLAQEPDHVLLAEHGKKLGLSVQRQRAWEEYLSTSPVLPPDSPLFAMLDAFCERFHQIRTFTDVDVNHTGDQPASPIHRPLHDDVFDDVLMDMRTMEQRYAFENELIEAVRLGQLYKQTQFFSAVTNTDYYEMRVSDPVRNVKNYCIIMNTLLRKAAEQGGVHPLYIDRISSEFAQRIEQMTRANQSPEMMQQIFRGYCTLVRQHTLQNYSRVVQTALLLIDSDLSANLTLHSLARNLQVSAGYLSTVFKQEMGQTLTSYIRERRMQHARHLLRTTNLQIGTVALHCGIPDLHYFTKLFKKETGISPGQYRENGN